ncbi:MAG TPA: hypothetical protein VFW23_19145, partial [Tepidisphaeraceae bacterium]|nr:hypothetical protein [Tepidisphaeraceae bacterium]
MDRDGLWRALEEQASAQLALQVALIGRDSAVRDPRLDLGCCGLILKLAEAVSATTHTMAALKSVSRRD